MSVKELTMDELYAELAVMETQGNKEVAEFRGMVLEVTAPE